MKKYLLFIIFSLSICLSFAHPVFYNQQRRYDFNNVKADSSVGFDILHYDIYMDLNTTQSSIDYGFVITTVNPDLPLTQIIYELESLTVDSVFVNGIISEFTHQNGEIIIPLNNLSNEFTTKVVYHGTPVLTSDGYSNGMRFFTNQVFTVSCPNAARYWFPCYDHPWKKALTDMRVKIRSDWMVASNGIRQSITEHNDGTSTTHWKNEEPIATYLISIAAANYVEQSTYHNGLLLQNFVFPGQAEIAEASFAVVTPAIDIFNELYGEYPFSKYGNAVASISNFAAMEHQTMTTIGSNYVNTNPTGERVIVHELAHSWFGNSLTALTWKDVWLSEGFATYSEALFIENYYNFAQSRAYVSSSYHNYYKNFTQSYGYKRIYDPVYSEYFYPMVYQKAACVLDMLRLRLGHETYFELIQQWFAMGHRNVVTSEFIQLAEEISQQDLTQFFAQWIFGSGYPNVSYNTLYDTDNNSLTFYAKTSSPTQTEFFIDIPVIFKDAQNTVLDSILITASPIGAWTSYQPNFNHDLNQIQILFDQNNWNLVNYSNQDTHINFEAFAGYNKITLVWDESVNQAFIGYNIYKQVDNEYTQINETLITDNIYTDYNVNPNQTYNYLLRPVFENNYELFQSFNIEITSSANPVNSSGILFVNETNHGNGSVLNPTNEQLMNFYNYTLSDINFDYLDVTNNSLPSFEELSNYAHIIWIDDDFQTTIMNDTYQSQHLAKYLQSGGQLFISGFRTTQFLTSNFLRVFTNLENTSNIINVPNPVFQKAISNNYQDIEVDNNKIPHTWTYGLMGVTYYEINDNDQSNSIYQIYTENENFNHLNNKTCAIDYDNLILIGFPLYFFESEQVSLFFQEIMSDWTSNDDTTYPTTHNTLEFSVYPNPYKIKNNQIANLKLNISNTKNQNIKVDIYNIKGQKITNLFNNVLSKGEHNIDIRSKNPDIELPSGIYFLKLETNVLGSSTKINHFKKITIIK